MGDSRAVAALGRAILRTSRVNLLSQAFCAGLGLAVCDGRSLWIERVVTGADGVSSSGRVAVDNDARDVVALCWSAPILDGAPISSSPSHLLAAVHGNRVRLYGASGVDDAVAVGDAGSIDCCGRALGASWHPSQCALAVVDGAGVSVHFRKGGGALSAAALCIARLSAPPKERMRCAAWTPNGLFLLVCFESRLLLARWDGVDLREAASVSMPFGVGRVSTLCFDSSASPLDEISLAVVATEAPEGQLTSGGADLFEPAFDRPDVLPTDGSFSVNGNGILRIAAGPQGNTSSAFAFRRKDVSSTTAAVLLVSVCAANGDVQLALRAEAAVSGILFPDLVAFDGERVYAGSNATKDVHEYRVDEASLSHIRVLSLPPNSRPKGLAIVRHRAESLVCVLAGAKPISTAPLFAAIKATEEYDVVLQVLAVARHGDALRQKTTGSKVPSRAALNGASQAVDGSAESDSGSDDEIPSSLLSGRLLLPGQADGHGPRLVMELASSEPTTAATAPCPPQTVETGSNAADSATVRAIEALGARMDAQFARVFAVLSDQSQRIGRLESALAEGRRGN